MDFKRLCVLMFVIATTAATCCKDYRTNTTTSVWGCADCNCNDFSDENATMSARCAKLKPTRPTCCRGYQEYAGDTTKKNSTTVWGCTGCNCNDFSDENATMSARCPKLKPTRPGKCCRGYQEFAGDTTRNSSTTVWGCTGCNCNDFSDEDATISARCAKPKPTRPGTCCRGYQEYAGDTTRNSSTADWGCTDCNCLDFSDEDATISARCAKPKPTRPGRCCRGYQKYGGDTTSNSFIAVWGCTDCNCNDFSDENATISARCVNGTGNITTTGAPTTFFEETSFSPVKEPFKIMIGGLAIVSSMLILA